MLKNFRPDLTEAPSPSIAPGSEAPVYPTVRFFDAVGAVNRVKKRKTDNEELPVELDHLPESEIYTRLLEYEKRVENTIETRKIEVADVLQRVERLKSVLRIYIWNESHVESEPSKESSFWKLKITGRLLPLRQKPGEVAPDITEADSHHSMPFAHFIKSLEIDIDPQNLNGQSAKVKWTKSVPGEAEKEVFEVSRPGDKILPLKIHFIFDNQPPMFRLMDRFSKLLGFELGTRSKVITEFWNYVKTKNLQTNKDPSIITCDAALKALFNGAETIQLSMLSAKLTEWLAPADRITLDYSLQLDGYAPAVFDIELELPSMMQSRLPRQFFRHGQDEETVKLDRFISDAMSKIREHKRRRAFYMGFAQNPMEFLNALLKAQSKEVRLIKKLGERDRYEVDSQTEFFKGKWVEDAVVKYFQRRLAAGH